MLLICCLAGDNALVIALAAALRCPSGSGVFAINRRRVDGRAIRVGGHIPRRQAAAGGIRSIRRRSVRGLDRGAGLDRCQGAGAAAASPGELWRAIGSIVLADLTMSTDNILAVAGASRGNIWLIVFGLALSIPLVVSRARFWRSLWTDTR